MIRDYVEMLRQLVNILYGGDSKGLSKGNGILKSSFAWRRYYFVPGS